MKINLIRTKRTDKFTAGDLFIDGKFFCHTLEDADRGLIKSDPEGCRKNKIPDSTCIPVGQYEITITFSNRFQKLMPLILDVPAFEGIRVHTGNRIEDTAGCPLIGNGDPRDGFLEESRPAYEAFFAKLHNALQTGKVFINIE